MEHWSERPWHKPTKRFWILGWGRPTSYPSSVSHDRGWMTGRDPPPLSPIIHNQHWGWGWLSVSELEGGGRAVELSDWLFPVKCYVAAGRATGTITLADALDTCPKSPHRRPEMAHDSAMLVISLPTPSPLVHRRGTSMSRPEVDAKLKDPEGRRWNQVRGSAAHQQAVTRPHQG